MILLYSMSWSAFLADTSSNAADSLFILFTDRVWQMLCIRYELRQHPKNNTPNKGYLIVTTVIPNNVPNWDW
jgi:hypothetical protein